MDFVALDYVALATNYSVNRAVERSAAVLHAALLAVAARRLVHSLRVSAVCRLQSLLSAAGVRRFVRGQIRAVQPDGVDIPLSAVGGSCRLPLFSVVGSLSPVQSSVLTDSVALVCTPSRHQG